MVFLRVLCLSGRSRAPPVRSFRRLPSLFSNALGGSILTIAAASSMAKGSPSSLTQISATAGALSLVIVKSGLTAFARSTKSLTASYCVSRSKGGGALEVGPPERWNRELLLAIEPQWGTAGREHLQAGSRSEQLGYGGCRPKDLLEVV